MVEEFSTNEEQKNSRKDSEAEKFEKNRKKKNARRAVGLMTVQPRPAALISNNNNNNDGHIFISLSKSQDQRRKTYPIMHFVITGGTGKQGRATIDALLRGVKCQITALVRDPNSTKSKELEKIGCTLVKGDMTDKESMVGS